MLIASCHPMACPLLAHSNTFLKCPLVMDTELYDEAAEILRKLQEKRASLKTLIYASKYKNVRRLFALVSECSKHRELIEEVMTQFADRSVVAALSGGNSEMAVVLLYEFLLGHKFGRTVGLRKMVQEYKNEIAGAVGKVLLKHQAGTLLEVAGKVTEKTVTQIPRYMRVNLIKTSVEDVVEKLVAEGWNYVGKLNIDQFPESVRSLDKWQFGLDPQLFDLLVFPVGTDLHDHPLTKSGELIQQDRASCVPAHVLNPTKGSVVLDCCSAPGNKASHLASLMNDTGRVIALDRDHKRMATMYRLIETSGATCVEMIVQDFLTVQPDSSDAQDIQFILVDPSCSGSGMLGSKNEKYDPSSDSQRLQTLKRFQILILKRALRFPAVQRVVYSTCSVHAEENEQVVEEVMGQVSGYFKFKRIFPLWAGSRGLDEYPNSRFFLRLSPEIDLTQGFFVACFERIKSKYAEQEDGVMQECHTLDIDVSKEVTVDASEINKSRSKKRKKSMTNKNISEDETIMEHSASSIKAGSLEISKERKQKVQKTAKSDLNLGTSRLKPDNNICVSQKDNKSRLLCGVIPSGDYDNDGFVQNSNHGNKNVTEESSRNKKRKKEPNSEPSLSNESLSSTTSKLKKKKHKEKLSVENIGFASSQKQHKTESSISHKLNLDSHEKFELISDMSVEDKDLLSTVCRKKKKKKKKKECD